MRGVAGRPVRVRRLPVDGRARIASPIAGEAVPRIVSFRVEHFRGDKPPLSLGIIGESSWAVSFDDDVRVQASLDATPYSYLFAVSPNGCVELCDSTIGAGARSEVRYPTGQDYHGLKDGLGWQTFVLLVSRKPLRALTLGRNIPAGSGNPTSSTRRIASGCATTART